MKASKDYPANYKAVKFVNMGFKKCIYKTKSASGKNIVGRGATDFINKKHLEKHKFANYNFLAEPRGQVHCVGNGKTVYALASLCN